MRTRGRRSAAETAAVIVTGAFGRRPDPPEHFTERQADIWREVVASEDVAFFNSGALRGMLADYCRHREAAERINEHINKHTSSSSWPRNIQAVKRYQLLLRMRAEEVRGAATLATKLRLTNQSRYVPHAAARAAAKAPKAAAMPWEA
jgi:hypothetical protein